MLFYCYSTWQTQLYVVMISPPALYCTVLYCVLLCPSLFSVLYSTLLYSTLLHSTLLYSTVPKSPLLSSAVFPSPLYWISINVFLSDKKYYTIAYHSADHLTWQILSLPPDTANVPDPDCPTTDLTDWGRRLSGSWRRTLFARTLNSTDSLMKLKYFIIYSIWLYR